MDGLDGGNVRGRKEFEMVVKSLEGAGWKVFSLRVGGSGWNRGEHARVVSGF